MREKKRNGVASVRHRRVYEQLEDRRVLATFTVNSVADDGDFIIGDGKAQTSSGETTLRAAIEELNAQPEFSRHTIYFDLAGPSFTIAPTTPLPAIERSVVIDGYEKQLGAAPPSLFLPAQPVVEINGSQLDPGKSGLVIEAIDVEVRGLVINGFLSTATFPFTGGLAIALGENSGNALIEGNFLGTDVTGTVEAPNGSGVGVFSEENRIGGDSPFWGNLMSGNVFSGVRLFDVNNTIQNNLIGTNLKGDQAVANQRSGIYVNSSKNTIKGNVVAASGENGIWIGGEGVSGNQVTDNRVGTNRQGTAALKNTLSGISIENSNGNIIVDNLLSGNKEFGLRLDGPKATGNSVSGNTVGLARDGTKLGNQAGISITNAPSNVIEGNTLSGNRETGLLIAGPNAESNQVRLNLIGLDGTGILPRGNEFHGIEIADGAHDNTIGGESEISDDSFGNYISANGQVGILVREASDNKIRFNFIGTNIKGEGTDRNFGNKVAGISLHSAATNLNSKVQNTRIIGNTIGNSDFHGIYLSNVRKTKISDNKFGIDADGSRSPNRENGVYLFDSPENELSDNVVSSNGGDGIRIEGRQSFGNKLHDNRVEFNVRSGISLKDAPLNEIGGDKLGNTVSFNGAVGGVAASGIVIAGDRSTENVIQGNRIGPKHDGTLDSLAKFSNFGAGILITDGASKNQVGGEVDEPGSSLGNIIAHNKGPGIHIKLSPQGNKVQGNRIGLKNGANSHGILIENSLRTSVGEIIPPTPLKTTKNVISNNTGDGVRIQGKLSSENTIRVNVIRDNKGLGINLVGGNENLRKQKDGVTPNDEGDDDVGANGLMNFPVGVTPWTDAGTTIISGYLEAEKPQDAVVDIYGNAKVNSSGFGGGSVYLGSATPDGTGVFRLEIVGWSEGPEDRFLSATATDSNGFGSTSEFSPVYGDPDGDGKVDSDGDGLPDDWELDGIDFDGDGETDLPLLADPDRKNILVEIDYVVGHKPTDEALDLVKAAFHRAPVLNPDGTQGIDLELSMQTANAIPNNGGSIWWEDPQNPADPRDTFSDLKFRYRGNLSDGWASLGARRLAYHYAIFGDLLADDPGTTGIAEGHGDDLFITVGGYNPLGKVQREAETFMHELGHNLGLLHGGPMPDGEFDQNYKGPETYNHKPNHLSVMNYTMRNSVVGSRRLDYSRFDNSHLITLDENDLDEEAGIDGGKLVAGLSRWPETAYTYWDSDGQETLFQSTPTVGWINWDSDAKTLEKNVTATINDPKFNPNQPGSADLKSLSSMEEWSELRYNFRGSPAFEGDVIPAAVPGSFGGETDDRRTIDSQFDSDADGLSNDIDNAPFVANPDQTDVDGDGIGDAGQMASFQLAQRSTIGGDAVIGTVRLRFPAPAGGAYIDLVTSDLRLAEVPEFVTIPAGEMATTFTVSTSPLISDAETVDVSAFYGYDLLQAKLDIDPGGLSADLQIAGTVSNDAVQVGGSVTYSFSVTNQEPTTATGVTLKSAFSSQVDVLSAKGVSGVEGVPGPGLSVRFDYSYDTSGFFADPERRQVLEVAAERIVGALGDDLSAISPGGADTWTATFNNPATGTEEQVVDLEVAENELVIFVGARDLGDSGLGATEGAVAAPGGYQVSGVGPFQDRVKTRNESGAIGPAPTDFGPWGGAISFNTNPSAKFHGGLTTEGLDANEFDLLTVAMHEIAHVLGWGTADSWQTYVDAGANEFNGPASVAAHDSDAPIPLEDDLTHWQEGIVSFGNEPLMDPVKLTGTRIWFPTVLDWAGLSDIGWNTDGQLQVGREFSCDEVLGAVSCGIGALSSDESATVTIQIRPQQPGELSSTAVVSSSATEIEPNDNSIVLQTSVSGKAAIIVNAVDDTNDGVADETHTSLREAIELANARAGVDTILFDIAGPGPHTIRPLSALPVITDSILIDGTSEPDFAGTPIIELDGSLAGDLANGLHVSAGGSTIRGLVINRFQADTAELSGNGIVLEGGAGNRIEGNYIGTDITGTNALGNGRAGVLVMDSDNNVIGGWDEADRNVISGNGTDGILTSASGGNEILGNYVGVSASGNASLGNQRNGVSLYYATGSTIGGSSLAARNVISGNQQAGIDLSTAVFSRNNRVQGNFIGVNASGDAAIGNEIGVVVHDRGTQGTTIGGPTADEANVISGNRSHGISATSSLVGGNENNIIGNRIGTQVDGSTPLGNGGNGILINGGFRIGGTEPGQGNVIAYNGLAGVAASTFHVIRGNSIYSNAGLGLDLLETGVTPNDVEDMDYEVDVMLGLQHPQNFPELNTAFSGAGGTTIEGVLSGPTQVVTLLGVGTSVQIRPTEVTIDFYSNSSCDPSGHGEGQNYLGSTTVINRGLAHFSARVPMEIAGGQFITATATQPFGQGNTSEFSACLEVRQESDGDGVPDEVENAGPNGGDANQDGLPDSTQRDIATLRNAVDGRFVWLEASDGLSFRNVQAIDNPAPATTPAEVSFPIGLFDFTLDGNAGSVTVHPPSDVELASSYHFGPTPDGDQSHWYQLPSAEVVAGQLVLPLRDGITGDHDLEANSAISTLAGPAYFPPNAGTTIVVNSADDVDDGVADATHTSLREAINQANFLPGKDLIVFNIPGDGPHSIRPTSVQPNPNVPFRVALPPITDAVVIDGYSQPGAKPATHDEPATLLIELDGSDAEGPVAGLELASNGSTIRGLVINRFPSGPAGRDGMQIELNAANNNVIEGNHIGTDFTGTTSYFESGFAGVQRYGVGIAPSSQGNIVGGTTPAARNVISGLSTAGIYAWGRSEEEQWAANNQIIGNIVGLDATGTTPLANEAGIWLTGNANQNSVGNGHPNGRNIISGNNQHGVMISSLGRIVSGNSVLGNFIGTDITGTLAIGNQGDGVSILQGRDNIIGGPLHDDRNVISGNQGNGISIQFGELASANNIIQGNFVGTDLSGTSDLGNAGAGVWITGSGANQIGGIDTAAGNVIAFNGQHGVAVEGQCFSEQPDDCETGNSILKNSIHSNASLGIDFGVDGVTPNDRPNVDPKIQRYPVLNAVRAVSRGVDVSGTLESDPNATFRIEFYASPTADPSGNGEGQTFLGSVDVATDTNGLATFDASLPSSVSYGHVVTATATDESGFTSEFSAAVRLDAPLDQLDFGDAPDLSYATRLDSNGARHVVVAGFYLGAEVDAEPDGIPSPDATSDDVNGRNDEGGVVFLTPFTVGGTAAMEVLASAVGQLDAWVDLNADGDWLDDGEQIFQSEPLDSGENSLFFEVPTSALITDRTYARFRFSSLGGLPFDGLAADGEVEDYAIPIKEPLPPDPGASPPVAVDDDTTTTYAQPVIVDVARNDTDVDGNLDATAVMLVAAPANGTAFVSRDSGLITYIPNAGFVGIDTFAYEIRDTTQLSDSATVSVQVAAGNRPPSAADDAAVTEEDTRRSISVTSNDADLDDGLDLASVSIWVPPANGTLSVDATTGVVDYTPYQDFVGHDAFVYRVFDFAGATDVAVVEIEVTPVNDDPVLIGDRGATLAGSPVSLAVLANDSDPEGPLDVGSLVVVDGPSRGSAIPDTTTGEIAYTPDAGFTGQDSFSYRVNDLDGSPGTASVIVDVIPAQLPPFAADDLFTTKVNLATDLDVVANDSDVDGDLDPTSIKIVDDPTFGDFTIDPDSGVITFMPATGFEGVGLFTYEISDLTGESDTALVIVDVVSDTQNQPPQATEDVYETSFETQLNVGVAGGLLANDSDPEGDTLQAELVDGPSSGSVTLNADGSFTYQPAADFVGIDEFTYRAIDQNAGSDLATVTITVQPISTDRSSIAGYVYADVNVNGVKDPVEMGIPNTPITISGPITKTVLTKADGSYVFEDLPAGTYSLTENQPAAFIDGQEAIGTPAIGRAEDDRFVELELDGVDAVDFNFGERGLRPELVSKALFLTSTPSWDVLMQRMTGDSSDMWLPFHVGDTSHYMVTIGGEAQGETIEVYSSQWSPIAISDGQQALPVALSEGEDYWLHVAWDEPTGAAAPTVSLAPIHDSRHNVAMPLDVSGDGMVSPRDALIVIREINRPGTSGMDHYPDVNGDQFVSPVDVLLVINHLNSNAASESQGGVSQPSGILKGAGEPEVQAAASPVAADWLFSKTVTSRATKTLSHDRSQQGHHRNPASQRRWQEPRPIAAYHTEASIERNQALEESWQPTESVVDDIFREIAIAPLDELDLQPLGQDRNPK